MTAAVRPGRRCAICGGQGSAWGFGAALRSIKVEADQRGITLHWHSFDLADGKAHARCIAREQRKLEQ